MHGEMLRPPGGISWLAPTCSVGRGPRGSKDRVPPGGPEGVVAPGSAAVGVGGYVGPGRGLGYPPLPEGDAGPGPPRAADLLWLLTLAYSRMEWGMSCAVAYEYGRSVSKYATASA